MATLGAQTQVRVLKILRDAGPLGIDVTDFALEFWPAHRLRPAKERSARVHRGAGGVLQAVVDPGLAYKVGERVRARYGITQAGREWLEAYAREVMREPAAPARRAGG